MARVVMSREGVRLQLPSWVEVHVAMGYSLH